MKVKITKSTITFTLLIISFFAVSAQRTLPIYFKTGEYISSNNINAFLKGPNYSLDELVNNNYYRIIQFENIPTTIEKKELKNAGIELLNYLPKNAFYASINKTADFNQLLSKEAIAVFPVKSSFKLNENLNSGIYPKWAMYGKNMIEINAVYYNNIAEEIILNFLHEKGLEVTMSNHANTVRFRVLTSNLSTVYELPYFYYFEEIDKPGEPEGIEDITNHRSNTLATDYLGGLKYDGTGVTVMLQDNSILDEHIDYTGRFTNDPSLNQIGSHGEHTGGIIAAAGNLDPKGKGMAYGADVLVYGPGNDNYNEVPTLYNSNNLTITSKSYGNGNNAGYTALASQLDQQSRTLPSLIHVFSAGNSGVSDHGYGAGAGWGNITGGHKQAKNVIAVGNVSYTDGLHRGSSRGPAADGRIKPDICAVGTDVYSTNDPNNYINQTGTSMSCPGVAGVLAQLYHAYKDLNSGANPNAALMKAAILNTADDLGNSGPDFKHGWGRINARRAYNLISNNNYLSSTISQGASNSHTITVPANTHQLKVMVYWTDYEGVASSSPALVNDINMELVDPSATKFDPWVLDPTPNATTLNSVATRGIDDLNNVEQVTIDNPVGGTYTLNINGFAIPQGPQEYYVVYEFIQDEVILTYPIGREGFDPGTTETIRWDSYGGTGNFNLEYSTDNGASWNTISASVTSSLRHYDWTVPNILSGRALVKVTRGAQSSVSDKVFSIIPTPTNLQIDWACPDSMRLTWDPVTGASGYEASILGVKYMDSVGVTTTNGFVYSGIDPASTYWLSVRALGPNNARGERAIAIEKVPGTFSCPIPVDVSLLKVLPQDGEIIPSCVIPQGLDVVITINNEGKDSITNVPVHYILNGGAAVNEMYSGTLASGTSFDYTFTTQPTLITGINNLLVWSDMTGDGNQFNDSISLQFEYSNATAKTLPWSEDFEGFKICGTSSNCDGEVCVLTNDFINSGNGLMDDIDWRIDAGGTPSINTGPSQDYSPGTNAGKYLYLEPSGNCFNRKANLYSPCIDLNGTTAPRLSFAYHMSGSSMGDLHVDILSNGVWVNDITAVISGNQGTSWLTKTVDLSAYTGEIVLLRFRGITGDNFWSDMAIDAISITDPVGIDESGGQLVFDIQPNPSKGIFTYNYQGQEDLNIEVSDITGKVVYTSSVNPQKTNSGTIDITSYANGIYVVSLITANSKVVKKIVKE